MIIIFQRVPSILDSFVADKLIQSLSIQRVLEINKLQKDLGSMHNELCEVIDCGYPAAQMLCEHCIDQVQGKINFY